MSTSAADAYQDEHPLSGHFDGLTFDEFYDEYSELRAEQLICVSAQAYAESELIQDKLETLLDRVPTEWAEAV